MSTRDLNIRNQAVRSTRSYYTLSLVYIVRSTAFGGDIAPESFERAKALLRDAIDAGEVAGGVHLVARDGKTRYLS